MSTVEIIKHTVDAVTTPAISPEFVETDDNLVLGFAFVVLDGTIVDRAFVKEKCKFQSFALVFVLL